MTCTSLPQLWEKVRAITDVELWYDCPTLHYPVFGVGNISIGHIV